ncbi:GNAT family protein [Bacillus sp. FJAT-47783]|uniref:GNAT family N-acetyltransferase n=1 Tax=Bacillus sp. FJAT-47783 TaxID=2922712 RepID=UPI001FACBED2|nr:GNAT family protein [Bacillus sp. FJAT-47783]
MFILPVDENISIQLLQLQHADELFHLVDDNRNHLRKWLPWVDSMQSPVDYHTIIPLWLEQLAKNNGFNGGIRYKGQLVGMIGLHYIDWSNLKTSIGYYIGKHYEGKGIITRSVQAVLYYIFQELQLNRVEIRCGVNNLKSRAIPERLGFKQEGIIREDEWLYDHAHDLVVYGLLKKEFVLLTSSKS